MKKVTLAFVILLFCFNSTFADEIAVTVYNDNLALVKDMRSVDLKKGVSLFQFHDVSAQIDPTSVHFKSITSPNKVAVLEQNFEYDLVEVRKIMEKYLDKEIAILMEEGEEYSGKLLSYEGKSAVLQNVSGINIVSLENMQSIQCERLPEGLITKPTLVWQLQNNGSENQDVEVSYLTKGMKWHAEYVAVTDAEDKNLEINGWVSVENTSGATYENAKLKLIAGDVNLVKDEYPHPPGRMLKSAEASGAPSGFQEKSFFEYHMYTLGRKTTLKNNQTKQVSLFEPATAKAEKKYIYNGFRGDDKVEVKMEFKNSKEAGMGMPLPKGKVRVYKKDTDGSLEFIGEDKIDHTPKDEPVRILLGKAFDIRVERMRKDTKRISDRVREETFEIKLKNHKDENIKVTVVEKLWGTWEIIENSHDFIKQNASTLEFTVPVPKDGETVINYTARLTW